MKFCPFCGASLVEGAAFFCPECGEELRPPDERRHAGAGPASEGRKPAKGLPPAGLIKLLQKDQPRRIKKSPVQPVKLAPDPSDLGYDGYYEDIKPIDSGRIHDKVDSGLIKQVVYFAAGAAAIIILAVVAMYLL